ncbi:TIGR01244 family sulfur transferase [Brevundimonas basaltis]|uniref:Sulfide:quinone oxidoreductase n=1 Tax=Brevundimonas basaltis TaxID=472166 RepID=A0A7W8MGF3_9CAUL|nr:TIGR01244 family sulfur transferase [Brevundimonas basaltis]MBB5291885.1 sulfide:quinone oxidoreductase [Brevundimonas basaltis]
MDIRPLDGRLSASPQIAPEDMPAIAGAGFRSVVSNRPDGEGPDQPSAAEIEAAARETGLAFAHVPVVGGAIEKTDIDRFRQVVDDLPKPVLGFCRTGTRTTTLWALQHAGERSADELIDVARAAGYDISGLAPRLQAAK